MLNLILSRVERLRPQDSQIMADDIIFSIQREEEEGEEEEEEEEKEEEEEEENENEEE